MKNICVFCGSSAGNQPQFISAAKELGALIAKNNCRLVYGGGNIGLMGAVADSVMEHGGEVIGVIPEFLLDQEVGHKGLNELIVVDSMHTRKHKMASLADAFIAMPGGFGTLEELAEIITWVQLSLVKSPVGLLNVDHYYDYLLKQLDAMRDRGFTSAKNRNIITTREHPEKLLHALLEQIKNGKHASDLDKT